MRRFLVALTVAGTAVLAGCAASGSAAEPTPTPTSDPAKTVFGDLAVEMDFSGNVQAGNTTQDGPCLVEDGYDDMREGATVAVLDASGTTVGMGELHATGLQVKPGSTSMTDTWCGFTFTVTKVPTGGGFYSIVIGGRDPFRITEDEAFDSPSLTLGDVPGS